MANFSRLIAIGLLAVTALNAQSSTWSTIQDDILNSNCAICHFDGSSFAQQSGLILTADVAYENLLDVTPTNSAAAADSLKRVSSEGSFIGLGESFFWEKVFAPEQLHLYEDHPQYGSIMPLGLPYLTNGELAYLRDWIEAGAPETGIVADTLLLDDTTRYEIPEFVALEEPTSGFQLHLGPYDVWSNDVWDREFFYFEPYVTTEDLYIRKYEISMRPWSHHFIVFNSPATETFPFPPSTYRDLRDESGVTDPVVQNYLNTVFPDDVFVLTQTPYVSYELPPGVVLRLPAGDGFDLNAHSVNRSGETQTGEAYINFHTADTSEVNFVASQGNISNYSITLPPNQETVLTYTSYFTEQTSLLQMWSHAHEHMTDFRVVGINGPHDGELLYWTNDWEHPPILQLDPPLVFNPGEGVSLITTYYNWTDATIHFGPLSTDEMQFLFYIYYEGILTGTEETVGQPTSMQLYQNYPNPFNPSTTIRYELSKESHISLRIFDLRGNIVRTFASGSQAAGVYNILWNGSNDAGQPVSTGIYISQLRVENSSKSIKMLYMK